LVKVAELEPLKAQVSNLKQNVHIVKESNIKIGELGDELSTLKQNFAKLKQENTELSKSKQELESKLKETLKKSELELNTLRSVLDEAQSKSQKTQSKLDEMRNQLAELENERLNHQKLIKEYGKLEQRFEKVRSELMSKITAAATTTTDSTKSGSNLFNNGGPSTSSTNSLQPNSELESLIEEITVDEDGSTTKQQQSTYSASSESGFKSSSLSSSNSNHQSEHLAAALANFEANKLLYMTANGSEMDFTLITKLQRRIATLELERQHNNHQAESDKNNNNDLGVGGGDVQLPHGALVMDRLIQERDYEMIKSQELDFENQKLREDSSRLRDMIADNQKNGSDNSSFINKEMMNQFDALNEEVQRRRDECIQLKSLLIAKYRMSCRLLNESSNMNDLMNDQIPADLSMINTDGNEYEVGFNTQKILNRMLENQLTDLQKKFDKEKESLMKEIKSLRDENSRQQDLLTKDLSPESLAEHTYKNEIIKLTDQNLV
jgi:myosin-5